MVKQRDITQAQAEAAANPIAAYKFAPPRADSFQTAPHFVTYVRQLIEQQYGAAALYRDGLKVYTTIDLKLQTGRSRWRASKSPSSRTST